MNVSCSYGKCHPCNMYNPLTEFYQVMFCRWERTRAFLSPSEDAMCDPVQSFPLLVLRIYHFTFFWHNFPFIKQMSYFTIDNWKVTNKFPMWTQNFLVLWRMVLRKCEKLGTGQPASTDLRHRRPLMKCSIIIWGTTVEVTLLHLYSACWDTCLHIHLACASCMQCHARCSGGMNKPLKAAML